MFGMGMLEIGIVVVVLIVVVGPDDLPGLLRTVGRWVGSMQGMARDFRRQIDTMADDAGFAEEKKLFDQARNLNPNRMVQDFIDPKGEMGKELADADDALRQSTNPNLSDRDLWQPEPKAIAKTATPKEGQSRAAKPKSAKPKSAKPKAATSKAKAPKAQTKTSSKAAKATPSKTKSAKI